MVGGGWRAVGGGWVGGSGGVKSFSCQTQLRLCFPVRCCKDTCHLSKRLFKRQTFVILLPERNSWPKELFD